MSKKALFFLSIIGLFIGYILYQSYQLPFTTKQEKDGWISYTNEEVHFELPTSLSWGHHDKQPSPPSFTDGQYSLLYNYDGDAYGMRSFQEIVTEHGPNSVAVRLLDSLKATFPNQEEQFYQKIMDVLPNFDSTRLLTTGGTTPSYSYKTVVDSMVLISPLNLHPPQVERLKTYHFSLDTIDNCYRKIYYSKVPPICYAACLLRDLDPTNTNKTVIFAIEKIDATPSGTTLDQESILRILQSCRIVKQLH